MTGPGTRRRRAGRCASLERALAISEAVYGPDHPDVASALVNLGIVQLRLRNLEAARASLKRGLAIGKAVYGPDHPQVASALIYLGIVQIRPGAPEDARASLERGLEIGKAIYGTNHQKVAKTLIDRRIVRRGKLAKYLISFSLVSMSAWPRKNPKG